MNALIVAIALAVPVGSPGADLPKAAPAGAARASVPILGAVRPCGAGCSVTGLYRGRTLSGPWSVARRLEAARMRGDAAEATRLTAMLEAAVDAALDAEGTRP